MYQTFYWIDLCSMVLSNSKCLLKYVASSQFEILSVNSTCVSFCYTIHYWTYKILTKGMKKAPNHFLRNFWAKKNNFFLQIVKQNCSRRKLSQSSSLNRKFKSKWLSTGICFICFSCLWKQNHWRYNILRWCNERY